MSKFTWKSDGSNPNCSKSYENAMQAFTLTDIRSQRMSVKITAEKLNKMLQLQKTQRQVLQLLMLNLFTSS